MDSPATTVAAMDEVAVLARGAWDPAVIQVRWVPSTFQPSPALRAHIDATWQRLTSQGSTRLFDGPMCRLEAYAADADRLALTLSPTSYKPFIATHGPHAALPLLPPGLAGASARANALGSSAVIRTADGQLVFGVRTAEVALYPQCAHPFGGCLEPSPTLDVTVDTVRELTEEVGVRAEEIEDMRLLALGCDLRLMQPELVYACTVPVTAATLAARVDAHEHQGLWTLADDPGAVAQALAAAAPLTPLTRLALVVWGGRRYGEAWYARHAPRPG